MPTITMLASTGSLPLLTLVSVCPPRMTAVHENPSWVRMLSRAKIVPPTNPIEYREITIVRMPVWGPSVAIKATQAAPIAENATLAATALWNVSV